jgi:hypothetical protein
MRVSPHTLTRLSGPRNVADTVFPVESRPQMSVSSITSMALPSLPSFASIRTSMTRSPALAPEPVGSWLPPPQSAQPAAAVLPAPQVLIERQDAPPVAVYANRDPVPLPPAAMPAQPQQNARTGRKNIANIFQDAWKR